MSNLRPLRVLAARAAVAVAVAVGGSTIAATAAHAENGSGADRTATTVAMPGKGSLVADINCTLTANVPFRFFGGPGGGGEQGIANITCTQTVSQLDITVGLIRNGSFVDIESHTNFANNFVTWGAMASPHVTGTYQTAAIGTVHWPNGTTSSFPQVNSASVFIS